MYARIGQVASPEFPIPEELYSVVLVDDHTEKFYKINHAYL